MFLIPTARAMTQRLPKHPLVRSSMTTLVGLAIGAATVFAIAPALRAQDASNSLNSSSSALELIDDASVRTAIRSLITDAAANGLPTGPLVTKVREGVAKRATPDRIRSATSLLAQRLAIASTALAPSRSSDELAAGADALQAGVAQGTLREMRQLWPVKPLTIPLGVLAEMVASGVPHASASSRVKDLLRKGASTAQLASLGTSVRADIAAGLAPDAAMELRSKGVLNIIHQQQADLSTAAPSTPIAPPTPPLRPGRPSGKR